MIIATAGHVDHGKTLLVKALTGVDTDRLPEEKKRGLTIDLGFAYLPAGEGATIGFVDVPGHERFIHNTLCGLAGLDAVLLTVAADDGPRPQTLEHLAILDLLGVSAGALVITKVDRVGASRVSEVAGQMKVLMQGTSLESFPVFSLSALTGIGIAQLTQHLTAAARGLPRRSTQGSFRLAVDRSFTIAGTGLVVTGTVLSGELAAGEQARALLAGVAARVRMIHAQNAHALRARAGERCALNLAGTELRHHPIRRGDWIVAGNAAPPVARFDAHLRVHAALPKPLAHWTPVHAHLAAADVTGRIAILEGRELPPGASGLVQIVLDRPIGAVFGDRFIVRDQSARHTLGGGSVIDIYPPARGRAKAERLAQLKSQQQADAAAALQGLLEHVAEGVDLDRFALNRNMTGAEVAQLQARVSMKRLPLGASARGFLPRHWERMRQSAQAAVGEKDRAGGSGAVAAEDILNSSGLRLPRDAILAVAEELVREGSLAKDAAGLHLPGQRARRSVSAPALWAKVEALLQAGGVRPPTVSEIAEQTGEPLKSIESILREAAALRLAVRVSQTRYFGAAGVARLAAMAQELGEQSDRRITAAAFRDRCGIGRNLSIEVLEFFDRVKYTRRIGDAHVLLRTPGEVLELSQPGGRDWAPKPPETPDASRRN